MSVLPPVLPAVRSKRRRWVLTGLVVLMALTVIVVAVIWFKLFRHVPREFSSPEEYFKYGSIGTEAERGVSGGS